MASVQVLNVSCKTAQVDAPSGAAPRRRRIWMKVKEQYELVEYQALPDYLRDNEYILRYYRADWPLKNTLLSIFFIHNETLNIWTHLLGFIIFLVLTIYTATATKAPVAAGWERMNLTFSSPTLQREQEQWPFFIFLLGAMTCLLTSSTCHLLSCHSRRVSSVMWRLDYTGIAVMIATSFYPPIYYIFQCQPLWRCIYLSGITAFGIAAVFITMVPPSPRYRLFRTWLFVSMGLSGVIPGAHALINNWEDPMCLTVLSYELAMVFFYLFGTLIYAVRIPERWKPGLFDIAGHSHQIFHVMVILGAYAHYKAALIVMQQLRSC